MSQSLIPSGSRTRTDPSPGAKETPETQVEQPGMPFWLIPLVMALVVLCVMITLIAAPPDAQPFISVYAQAASMLFCLCCTLLMFRRAARGRARWAWGFIALAQALFFSADITIIIITSQPTFSADTLSLADVFFLPFGPLTAVGAILFPAAQSTPARQVRIFLDVSIAVGAILGLALVFLIAPRLLSGTLNDYILIVYPVSDLTLLLVLVVLLTRGIQRTYRSVFLWLSVGMVFDVYADSAYNYFSLPGFHSGPSYSPGIFFVDPFWVAAAFAFSLAPLSLLRQRKWPAPWQWFERLTAPGTLLRPSGLLNQFLLLVLPVAVLVGLLLYVDQHPGQHGTSAPLIVLTALVVLLIISRQMLTQRDLVDARIANERARQLDALKDQFITSVNHELRTPLMTMQGYIHLLDETEAVQLSAAKRADMLRRAKEACEGLVHLVKSILDTRRIEQDAKDFTPVAVSVQGAMQAALSLIDPHEADPASRQITVDIADTLVVWGDAVRLQQVLTNLVSNAIKYSPAGTPITLRAQRVAERTGHLSGNRSSGQPMVEIIVQDQGLGIPADQKDLLFRRFVRLPREIASSTHGNGLGLYLCRTFTEAMEGRIWVESTGIAGEGSIFHVRLPVPPALSITNGAGMREKAPM